MVTSQPSAQVRSRIEIAIQGKISPFVECFVRRLADSLCEQGTFAATFIRPFALMAACDLDFLCLAGTAEAFGDTTNAQGILTQRDEFFAKFAKA